ncbi:AAA family ATPase [Pseudodesulfovibrio sp.]|uniref:AAA family ATPase n=1 Tax=unclassified Pseudodesulfovibrio TaxID=2661612 RepID=UPI003B001756
MISRIILENFMAHERTELELGPGVNALTGPNNTGKSAVVEALRCVAVNPPITHCIRHGAKEARVSVVMDDGARVTWIRKKRSAGYEITLPGRDEPEEPFWKLQGKVPDEVRDLLRLDLVELETGDPVDVHVGNQRDPIFLLNRPDSHAAAFFAASSESAHLLAMQNRLKTRTQDAKRRERDIEAQQAFVGQALDGLAPLPDIALQLERARELDAAMTRYEAEIPTLESYRNRLDSTGQQLERRHAALAVCEELTEPPRISEVAGLDRLIRQMRQVGDALEQSSRTQAVLAPAEAPPVPFDTLRLATLCGRLVHLDQAFAEAGGRSARLETLQSVPELANASQLAEIISKISLLERQTQEAGAACNRLEAIAEVPAIADLSQLAGQVAELERLADAEQRAGVGMGMLENQLRNVEERIGQVVDELGQCPTCGARIDRTTFLDHGRSHDA